MDSTRTSRCSAAAAAAVLLLLLSLSGASTDEMVEQRESTFDLDIEEMKEPEPDMMQREVDWSDFFDIPIMQVEVDLPRPKDFLIGRGGSKPRPLGPRGHDPMPRVAHSPPALEYNVLFPLARPTLDNLQAICRNGDRRPRYPDSYFPSSGYGQLKRRASAVNLAESWLSTCCQGLQPGQREETLCCVRQAWELSIKVFCEEDSSVKDRLYHCCRLTGSDRHDCFNSDAPNPNYDPTEEVPLPPLPSAALFDFDNSSCPLLLGNMGVRSEHMLMRSEQEGDVKLSQKIDINFPPGEPNAHSVKWLCKHQKLRPRYDVKCLSGLGYEWLARQAKTVNRMEKGFKNCCQKKNLISCSGVKWSEELDKFCSVKKGGKVDFPCCSVESKFERLNCFKSLSPDPYYNKTFTTEELSIDNLCETHKIIKNKFPVGFPLKGFVEQCCPLPEQEKTICIAQKVVDVSGSLCTNHPSPALRSCCRLPSQKTTQCVSKILMDAVIQATKVLRHKKKKCPLS